jgi:MoaA/NifB/PqqE/SkfB family radical SAM enzyme
MSFSFSGLFSQLFQRSSLPGQQDDSVTHLQHPFKAACYAPFKSLYFGHGGKVVACCVNRNHVLGVYPQQSVKEIWQGEKAEALRQALKANSFKLGCNNCEARILSGNHQGLIAAAYNSLPLNPSGYPAELQFELSNTCNLECVMCSGEFSSLIRTKREGKPPIQEPYDTAFVEQLKAFIPHLHKVSFFGGEPFLIDIYYTIWEAILTINPAVNIYVQTNGTVLNNRVKELLQKGNFHINVSVDSVHDDTYRQIRVNANWQKTSENIQWFANYCKQKGVQFGISICPLQQNRFELVDIIQAANSWNATAFIHQLVSPRHVALRALPTDELQSTIAVMEQQLAGYRADSETAKYNYGVITGYVSELKHLLQKRAGAVGNSIDSVFDFYPLMEEKLQRESLGYNAADIMRKLKQAMQGLEYDADMVERFRFLNYHHPATWSEMLAGVHNYEPDVIRQHIITNM